jgi:GT2 family glycosyltransferase
MSLSVIIPTFNNVEFLSELFNSIKKSNFDGEYEVLIGIESKMETFSTIVPDLAALEKRQKMGELYPKE